MLSRLHEWVRAYLRARDAQEPRAPLPPVPVPDPPQPPLTEHTEHIARMLNAYGDKHPERK